MQYIDFCLYFQDGQDKIFIGYLTLKNSNPNILLTPIRDLIKHTLISDASYQVLNPLNKTIKNLFPANIKSFSTEHINEILKAFTLTPCKQTQLKLF